MDCMGDEDISVHLTENRSPAHCFANWTPQRIPKIKLSGDAANNKRSHRSLRDKPSLAILNTWCLERPGL